MITILFLASNPQDTDHLAIEEEYREIDKRIQGAKNRDVFDLNSHWAIRTSDLQELFLRYKPNIVHFSGHGSKSSEIVLQDDLGTNCTVPPEAVSKLFSQFSDDIHCVVLNACYSKKQAEAIAEHIDCVIGMADTITDLAAKSFSTAFYQAIGYGRDVKSAFDLGCGEIHMEGLGEHETPILLSPKANPSSVIFQPVIDQNVVPEIHHQISDTLPSRETIAVDFIGRENELDILDRWFRDPESKLWVLGGYGGKGKTAIAYEFGVITKHKSPKEYEIIQWLSAKRKRFVEGTIMYVDSPDFTDLETAIDKLLAGYGFTAESSKSLSEKKDLVIELLTRLPALLIIDDVDSLEEEAEDAIYFFTMEVTKTPSNVLLTSRRALFGLAGITTNVIGFLNQDGIEFIQSRMELFGLKPTDFSRARMERILKITDSSPLYIEELLRLCGMGVGINEVIDAWEEKGGDIAREYSLKREFDMLSDAAKQVLLACCLNRGPSTIEDITVITGIKGALVIGAMSEINRLFLLPRPTVIKEVPRFDVNVNTRALVREVMADTYMYNKINGNIRRLAGELQISGKRRFEISEYIKHAATLMKLNRFSESEDILKEGLVKYSEDPDLLAQLGRTYARWKPSVRLTDARASFQRAAELRCMQEDMYHHWWSVECKEHEWSSAVEAGEGGLRQFPNSWKLKYRAGYAHSRLGSVLKAQFQPDRARYQLRRAQILLEEALRSVSLEDLDPIDRELHANIIRCLVLNCEAQGHIEKMKRFLTQWIKDHPQDADAQGQKRRLGNKFPN